jgi:hypothetical protein
MNLATNFSNALCGPLAFQLKQFLAFLFVAGGITMCAISIQLNSDGCSREFPLSEAQTVWAFIFCLISVIPAILSASYKASFLQRHVLYIFLIMQYYFLSSSHSSDGLLGRT